MTEHGADEPRPYQRDELAPNPSERGKGLSTAVALLGIALLVQPAVFELVASHTWNDLVVGGLLVVIGWYNYGRRDDERTANVFAAAVATVLGVWLLVAPLILGAGGGLGILVELLIAPIVVLLGAYSGYAARNRRRAGEDAFHYRDSRRNP